MTVTIAIPYHDGAAPFIERCVRSALGQTHRDVRVVVVGDGYAPPIGFTDPRLLVYTLDRNHRGAPFAQQVALLATPDEWYAPLGADDWLEPDHIERLLAVGDSAVATGRVFWHGMRSPDGPLQDEGIRGVWYETGIFRTDRLRAFGGYDPTEESGQDNCILWLLEVYGGLTVRKGFPTYHRVKRHYGSVSIDVLGTAERQAAEARTAAHVAAARTMSVEAMRRRRQPHGPLQAELGKHIRNLRKRMETMEIGQGGIDAVILSSVWDPAGIGARYAAASTPDLHIRAAHRQPTYLAYPRDLLWDQETDAEVRQLATSADVIHLDVHPTPYSTLGLDRLDKPAVLEHHGSAYRRGVALLTKQARRYRMLEAVSTVDLLRHAEGLTWLPAPYRVADLEAVRRDNARKPDGRVRVVQTPTSRAVKSTEKLVAAVRALQHEGLPVDLVLSEQVPWAEALLQKATADIFFDQVQLGYGCSAVEAWGMGLPVVAGGDAWTEDRMRVEFGSDDLPFYRAEDTEESIRDALRDLVLSQDLRDEYGARGHAHALRFHDEGPALERLAALYRQALDPEQRPARRLEQPGMFRNTRYPALRLNIDGDTFKFVGGRLRVRDGDRAEMVRLHALAAPESGITEETWE